MINPYANINWSTVQRIMSCSHEHCETQTQFGTLTESSGLQHFGISNYYPSVPVYPLSSMFENIPSNAISCPNAEHHNIAIKGAINSKFHINGLGSFFESGGPRGGSPYGCDGAEVALIIPQILDDLQFSDGGGVTINHPFWSGLTTQQIQYMLGLDNRVLGIEIFNSYREHYTDGVLDESVIENIKIWDAILKTGRRCWGFCVADHQGQLNADWQGRNILLVDEPDEHDCLIAYRNGAFYGQIDHTNLAFDEISLSGSTYTVSASEADTIKIVIDGKATTYNNTTATVSVPANATYIRAEAHTNADSIYSNPIMLKDYVQNNGVKSTNGILLFMS